MKKIKLLLACLLTVVSVAAFAQRSQVSGKVTDSKGEALPGAAVFVEGTTSGTLTGVDGSYSLQVPANATLTFSLMGYKTVSVPVAGQKTVSVALEDDSTLLDETIVVAFGTTTREAFTGSAAVVKSDDLQKRQTSNVTNALVGSVPGLQIRGASGAPGAGAGSISIRGINSMYADTEPLIIVDGAPYSASLTNIPQSDIESVTVLKDAASAALYGARGAAGVILVTTKRSKTKDAIVNVDVRWGINSRAVQDYETIKDPGAYYEAYYAQMYNYYFFGQGQDAAAANVNANKATLTNLGYQVYTIPDTAKSSLLIGTDGKLNPEATLGYQYTASDGNTYYLTPDNWQDAAYKNAVRKEYNVSVNGGNDRGSYYASVGYLNEDGIIEYSGYERLTARLKADYQAKKWLKIGGNVSYTHSQTVSNPNMSSSEYGSTNLMYYTSMIAPIYPIYVRVLDESGNPIIKTDEFGNQEYDYGTPSGGYVGLGRAFLQTGNPLGSNRYNKTYSIGNQMNGSMNAEIAFTENLKLNISSTAILGLTDYSDYDNCYYGPKAGVNGELNKYMSNTLRTNNIQTLNYTKSFGENSISAILGHEYYNTATKYLEATAQGGFSPEIQEIAAFATVLNSGTTSYSTGYNVEGYFASVNYDYADKYYVSGSFRRDASSRFDPDHRWGNFWSVGGAWILSKENFMTSTSSWLDILKLKASIGQQGNDGIGNWAYVDLYNIDKSSDTSMAPSFSRKGNPNISWETLTNMNVGVEFSILRGRVSGALDLYNKLTTDQLFWISIPESSGTRGYYGNVGDIANRGIEFSLNASLIRTQKIQWDVNFNISHNATEIVSLPEQKITENGGFFESPFWYKVGGPLRNYMTYAYAGVDETGQALYYYDEDLSKAGKSSTNVINKPGTKKSGTTTDIGEASRYECGTTMPVAFGGLSTSLRIGSFDFNASFDYQIGGKIYDSRYAYLMTPGTSQSDAGHTFHVDYANAWSFNNTSSNIPRWQYLDQYAAYGSDRFLTDASYFNFQSFSAGYSLPVSRIASVNKYISRARVYVMGENLGFFSARKGLDPRYSFQSANSMNVYSPVRTISGGIQLTF